MIRKKIARAALAASAALGMVAFTQGSAGAATISWSSSAPNFGTQVCGTPFYLTSDSIVEACLTYSSGGLVEPYALFATSASDQRIAPETVAAVPFGNGNTCTATAPTGPVVRYCTGPAYVVTPGCWDVVGVAQFTWYTQQTLVSPTVRICR